MIRQPLSEDEIFAWWRAALAGRNPTVYEDPQAGFFKRRLVKDGPWVPVKIWLEQIIDPETGELAGDSFYCCDVNGSPSDPETHWLWACMQPIAETDYDYLVDLGKYARRHAPSEPLADPRKPIDLFTAPPPTFKRRQRA